jgi:hypothetical protein
VNVSADITDPAGVASAQVNWTATNTISTTTGIVPLASLTGGTAWTARWTISIQPTFYDWTISWNVSSLDSLSNSSLVAGPGLTVLVNAGGCP